MATSPYLKENRLSQVIAALTAMGLYRYYKLSFEDWAERIANSPQTADHWGLVFAEHPEFFRIDESRRKASLVWRRQNPKNYDPKKSLVLAKPDVDALCPEDRQALSRSPLGASDITALISIAVSLHDRALEHGKVRDWWKSIVLSGGLAFLGAIAGAYLAKL